jgi:hypothetical protein
VLGALVDALAPGEMPTRKVGWWCAAWRGITRRARTHTQSADASRVLERAIEVAETCLDIPRIIDPADFLGGKPDELSVMTCVCARVIGCACACSHSTLHAHAQVRLVFQNEVEPAAARRRRARQAGTLCGARFVLLLTSRVPSCSRHVMRCHTTARTAAVDARSSRAQRHHTPADGGDERERERRGDTECAGRCVYCRVVVRAVTVLVTQTRNTGSSGVSTNIGGTASLRGLTRQVGLVVLVLRMCVCVLSC